MEADIVSLSTETNLGRPSRHFLIRMGASLLRVPASRFHIYLSRKLYSNGHWHPRRGHPPNLRQRRYLWRRALRLHCRLPEPTATTSEATFYRYARSPTP